MVLKSLPRNGRSGKSRRPAILEYGLCPQFAPTTGSHLARLEREQIERDTENRETDEDEFQYESPARAAERVRQFATIKDLLTTETLGTS